MSMFKGTPLRADGDPDDRDRDHMVSVASDNARKLGSLMAKIESARESARYTINHKMFRACSVRPAGTIRTDRSPAAGASIASWLIGQSLLFVRFSDGGVDW
jgi:hypothetical protein